MIDNNFLVFIPLLPLLGAILSGLFSLAYSEEDKGPGEKIISLISCITPVLSCILAFLFFFKLLGLQPEDRIISFKAYEWIHSGTFNIDVDFMLDPLSSVMILIVTFIGSLIHIYSAGYMHKDRGFARYFSYLNLFTFSMLILVMSKNIVLMFLGWEGVGLCSYLLIGFWFNDSEKAIAGNKAFITNRIGDFGFLMGIFLIFWTLQQFSPNSLDFVELKSLVGNLTPEIITVIAILLFIGATGKSAQIPLHVWLADAMAGPTPVSALIHAATMVTAGIYMIARLNFIYSLSPLAMTIVASVGLVTAFFAATVAITQSDIKKVLAYSTVSQLGFMFLGLGVGAYTAGVFHLFTHAFFKALLFLGAGSVIHALSNEQNIFKMGGLWSKLRITGITFAVGTLAICGIPPFAGFFSKDEILWKVWETGSVTFYVIALFTAGLTAFYMSRLFFLVFMGNIRNKDHHVVEHIHESPFSMTIPLIILALGSAIVGFLGIPHLSLFETWMEPVIIKVAAGEVLHEVVAGGNSLEYILMGLSVVVALTGIGIAYKLYVATPSIPSNILANRSMKSLYQFSVNKWFFDEFYNKYIIKPLIKGSDLILWKLFDNIIIDGFVNGISKSYTTISNGFREIHSGKVRHYAFLMLFGIVLMFVYTTVR